MDTQTYRQAILNSYADAVANNRKVIAVNAKRFGYSLSALFSGIVYTSLAGFFLFTSLGGGVNFVFGTISTVLVAGIAIGIYGEYFLILEREVPDDD